MDRRGQHDVEQPPTQAASARRFAPVSAEHDETYPMLAPAAMVAVTSDQEAEDVGPAAGHVNV